MVNCDHVIIAPQPHIKFTARDLEELGRPFQFTQNFILASNPLEIDDTTEKKNAESELAVNDEKVDEERKGGDSEIGSLRLSPDSESSNSTVLATRAGPRARSLSSSSTDSSSDSSSESSSSSDSSGSNNSNNSDESSVNASADTVTFNINNDKDIGSMDPKLKRVPYVRVERLASLEQSEQRTADKTKTLEPNDGAAEKGEHSKPPADWQRCAGVANEEVSKKLQCRPVLSEADLNIFETKIPPSFFCFWPCPCCGFPRYALPI